MENTNLSWLPTSTLCHQKNPFIMATHSDLVDMSFPESLDPFTDDQLLAHFEQPRFEQSSNHQTPFPQLRSLFRRRNLPITQPLRRRLLRRTILPIIHARKAHSMLIRRIILILIVRKRRSRMGCGRRLGIARCLLSGWMPGVSLVSEKIHREVVDGQTA